MELVQLDYFRVTAREESVSKAAEKLHISQPALSISIHKLEEELGVPLFDRISGRIRLNQMGQAFLHYTEQVFRNLHEARLELSSSESDEGMKVNVAGTTMGMCAGVIESYIERYPKRTLDYYVRADQEIKDGLEQGMIDFAICARPIIGHGISWTHMLDEHLVILVSPEHPLAKQTLVEIADLKDERFIVQRSANTEQGEFSAIFDAVDFRPQTSVTTNELEIAFRAVDAGAGIMVASYLTIVRKAYNPTRHVIIPLKTPIRRSVGIAKLDGHFLSKPARDLLDFAITYFHRLADAQEEMLMAHFSDRSNDFPTSI